MSKNRDGQDIKFVGYFNPHSPMYHVYKNTDGKEVLVTQVDIQPAEIVSPKYFTTVVTNNFETKTVEQRNAKLIGEITGDRLRSEMMDKLSQER